MNEQEKALLKIGQLAVSHYQAYLRTAGVPGENEKIAKRELKRAEEKLNDNILRFLDRQRGENGNCKSRPAKAGN